MKLEIGSAKNTPFTPSEGINGSVHASGMTMTTFLNVEKKMSKLLEQWKVVTIRMSRIAMISYEPNLMIHFKYQRVAFPVKLAWTGHWN